jgi:spore coat-associated protein N
MKRTNEEMTDTDRQERHRTRRRRGLIALLLTLSLGTLGAGMFSLAYFTDTDTTDGSFATGTIKLDVSPTTALFAVSGMLPGDTSTSTLTLTNNGSGQLRYSMTTAVTGSAALAGQLDAVVKTKGTSCATFNGTTLYTGKLNLAAFGNPAVTGDVGDPTLNSGAADQLCFRVSLPAASNDTFQGVSTAVTFTFNSEQTANNP